MLSSNCPLAPLYCLRKDHKVTPDPVIGPPMRPVCGAVTSYNQHLSHLISMLLQEVWKEEPDVCLSTEDLLAGIHKVNSEPKMEEMVVGSADVKALSPNLDIDFTVEKVCDVFYNSEIKVQGTDYDFPFPLIMMKNI